MKKLIAFFLVMLSSPAKAAISFGVTASVVSAMLGFDPFTWAIGSLGAAIVLIKTPHVSKNEDIINSIISILLAGFVAPWAAVASTAYFSDKIVNDMFVYVLAFFLSATWPALIKIGIPIIRKKLEV